MIKYLSIYLCYFEIFNKFLFIFVVLNWFIFSDLGSLDPKLYLVESENGSDINIALKYSILEDVISIIIFKCTFQVRHYF